MPRVKKKEDPMGQYIPTEKEKEAYLWGVRNNIRIAPKAVNPGNNTEWYVEIFSGGKWNHSRDKFGPVDVWKQVYTYYEFYHKKK